MNIFIVKDFFVARPEMGNNFHFRPAEEFISRRLPPYCDPMSHGPIQRDIRVPVSAMNLVRFRCLDRESVKESA